MGLVALLAAGALLAVVAVVVVIVRDARTPDRATLGWALARGIPSAPNELGWTSADGSVQCSDGVTLPAWTVEGGAPDGPCLLLIHGWRRSRIDSLRRLAWMLPHVRRAVLPDLRGHGDAPAGPSTLGVQDVKDMLQVLESQPGARWVVAGHSLGASVALRVAAAAAGRGVPLQGVLLMAPYGRIAVPLSGRIRSLGLPAHPAADIAAWVIGRLCGREEPARSAFARIAKARIPVMCVAAGDDHIVPADAVRALASEAASAGCIVTMDSDADATHDTLGTAHPSWAEAARASVLSRPTAAATTS